MSLETLGADHGHEKVKVLKIVAKKGLEILGDK
jgi:hypothetical protein